MITLQSYIESQRNTWGDFMVLPAEKVQIGQQVSTYLMEIEGDIALAYSTSKKEEVQP